MISYTTVRLKNVNKIMGLLPEGFAPSCMFLLNEPILNNIDKNTELNLHFLSGIDLCYFCISCMLFKGFKIKFL